MEVLQRAESPPSLSDGPDKAGSSCKSPVRQPPVSFLFPKPVLTESSFMFRFFF